MPRYQSPVEVHGVNTILEEGLQVEDLEVKDLLLFILAELKTINGHLAIVSDEEIDIDIDDEFGGIE